MDHTNHVRLSDDAMTEAVLNGAPILGPDDEKIGSISSVHGQGADAAVIVDVGGFLGIGAKPVELKAKELDLMKDQSGQVHGRTRWTKAELKDLPEYTPRPMP